MLRTILKVLLVAIISLVAMIANAQSDSLLMPYVASFYHEASVRGLQLHNNLTIVFADSLTDDDGNAADGIAEQKHGHWLVSIDREYCQAYKNQPGKIKALVFHELGHALLSRQHCKGNSLMNDIKEFNLQGDKKSAQLIDELFDIRQFNKLVLASE